MTAKIATPVYLSKTQVAERIGMKSVRSLNKMKLPPHDARIGDTLGWLPETIDAWHADRPGRGYHGSR